jgi:hypothetical protein
VSHGSTVRKVKVFWTYLAAFEQRKSIRTFNVDIPVHDSILFAGGDWGHVQRWMAPEVLLGLDRAKNAPMYLVVTEVDPPAVLDVSTSDIDEWLTSNEQRLVVDVDTAFTSLMHHARALNSQPARKGALRMLNNLRGIFLAR